MSGRVIEFFLHGKPRQKGNSKRAYGDRVVSPDGEELTEENLLGQAMPHAPPEPWTCPIRLDVCFVFKAPASPRWKAEAAIEGAWRHANKPDRGNLLKLIEDTLEGPFYVDDKQVCAGEVSKAYGPQPGYRIRLVALPQAESPRAAAARKAASS